MPSLSSRSSTSRCGWPNQFPRPAGDHPSRGRNPGQEPPDRKKTGNHGERDLQHITADSPGHDPQLLFPGGIAGKKKDTVRTGNQPDNPRVLILPSFLIFCGCFYNLYYTLFFFFAYFSGLFLHFCIQFFSVLSKLFQRYQFCYCFWWESISSCQIGGGGAPPMVASYAGPIKKRPFPGRQES